MSAASSASTSDRSGRAVSLILAFLLVIAAGVGLAVLGAGSLRPAVSDSGLTFRAVKDGTGEPIRPEDAALLDYVLTSDDGTVIDSSESHGGAQPMVAAEVFPGFAEAMARMKEGGQYHFAMPPKLAFGDQPPPPGFPAGNLNFDVRVQKIVRGGAAMLQQQRAMEQGQQSSGGKQAPDRPPSR